jgi:hypothetical protein
MRISNFALRLQPALMEEAKALAKVEGVALNQLINVALAEKLAATRTLDFFERYTHGADVAEALALLRRPRVGEPPRAGDELPESESLIQRRSKRAILPRALEILRKAGARNPSKEGDELLESWKRRRAAVRQEPRTRAATRSK